MKVVLCHGVFDLMHVGHVEHLSQAREMGDHLLVSVVPDRFCTKGKPIYDEGERLRLLFALKCVSDVILCDAPGPEKIIEFVKPDIYVRGSDYEGKEMPESALLRKLGIEVRYTKSIPPRTGDIIRKCWDAFMVKV